jgi:hypothetical protein
MRKDTKISTSQGAGIAVADARAIVADAQGATAAALIGHQDFLIPRAEPAIMSALVRNILASRYCTPSCLQPFREGD